MGGGFDPALRKRRPKVVSDYNALKHQKSNVHKSPEGAPMLSDMSAKKCLLRAFTNKVFIVRYKNCVIYSPYTNIKMLDPVFQGPVV